MSTWLVRVNLGCQLDTPGNGNPQLKIASIRLTCWYVCVGIFLIAAFSGLVKLKYESSVDASKEKGLDRGYSASLS